jgi:hypothetical protein
MAILESDSLSGVPFPEAISEAGYILFQHNQEKQVYFVNTTRNAIQLCRNPRSVDLGYLGIKKVANLCTVSDIFLYEFSVTLSYALHSCVFLLFCV